MGTIFINIPVTSSGDDGDTGLPEPIPAVANDFVQTDGAGGATWGPLTQDQISPGFSIALSIANGAAQTIEIGNTTSPTFNRTFTPNGTGLTADAINDGSTSVSVLGNSNPVSPPSNPYTKTANGATVGFFEASTRSGVSKNSNTITFTWAFPILAGSEASPVATQGFLDTLQSDSKQLHTNRAGNYSFTLTTGKWACVALATSLGTPVFKDSNGFSYTPTNIGSVNWTNAFSQTTNMTLWTVGVVGTSTTTTPSYTLS